MAASPFKFLNAFEREDINYFFGRDEEIEDLYEMTYDTRLILLYGASGTGKTSLVQCGLANKFKETRWKDIFIRRDTNINDSIDRVLKNELVATGAHELGDTQNELEMIEQIYRITFKPIFLIFDQFEELFLVNPNKTEQEKFFQFIKEVLNAKLECKILLIMREEFIAHLWNYEPQIPSLFDHRYRVEPMRYIKAKKAITNTLDKLADVGTIQTQNTDEVTDRVLEKLTKGKKTLELTYLQVFLDQLFQRGSEVDENSPLFSPDLVEQVGSFEDIIGEFLSDQIKEIEKELGKQKTGIPIKILGEMITDERTKKVLDDKHLEEIRLKYELSKEAFFHCIQAFENMRILKRHE